MPAQRRRPSRSEPVSRQAKRWSATTGSAGSRSPVRTSVGMEIIPSFSASRPGPRLRDGGQGPRDRRRVRPISTFAVEGTARSAFGFGGQKCSAAPVFVDPSQYEESGRLVDRAAVIAGRPASARRRLSPWSTPPRSSATEGRRRGLEDRRELCGGRRLTAAALGHGLFVATDGRARDRRPLIYDTQLFVPLIADHPWRHSTRRSSERTGAAQVHGRLVHPRPAEIDRFLARIEAGVVYISRVRPAPRPAPGPASTRSAGGRARVPPGRAAAALATSGSTSTSSPAPSSRSAHDLDAPEIRDRRRLPQAERWSAGAVNGEAGRGVAVDAGDDVGDEHAPRRPPRTRRRRRWGWHRTMQTTISIGTRPST